MPNRIPKRALTVDDGVRIALAGRQHNAIAGGGVDRGVQRYVNGDPVDEVCVEHQRHRRTSRSQTDNGAARRTLAMPGLRPAGLT